MIEGFRKPLTSKNNNNNNNNNNNFFNFFSKKNLFELKTFHFNKKNYQPLKFKSLIIILIIITLF